MIEFKCESCGARVKAPPSLAGKAGKCPKCGTLNRVPPQARPPASEPESGADTSVPVPAEQLRRQAKPAEPVRSAPAHAKEPTSDHRLANEVAQAAHLPARPAMGGKFLLILVVVVCVIAAAGVGGYLAVRQVMPGRTAPERPKEATHKAAQAPSPAQPDLHAMPPIYSFRDFGDRFADVIK